MELNNPLLAMLNMQPAYTASGAWILSPKLLNFLDTHAGSFSAVAALQNATKACAEAPVASVAAHATVIAVGSHPVELSKLIAHELELARTDAVVICGLDSDLEIPQVASALYGLHNKKAFVCHELSWSSAGSEAHEGSLALYERMKTQVSLVSLEELKNLP